MGSENYYVLKPVQEISFLDLLKILFSNDLEKRKVIDPLEKREGRKENFNNRLLIFLSVSMQMFLYCMAKPMSGFGLELEKMLNVVSSNGNIGLLLLNYLRGKVEKVPDKESEKFLSVIGNLDTRRELDKRIKHGDPRYYAMLSAMASKISYENYAFVKSTVENLWKMELKGYYNFRDDSKSEARHKTEASEARPATDEASEEKATTQAFMLHDKNADPDIIVIAFRGTEPFDADAWITDVYLSWIQISNMKGKIHGGFMKALGLRNDWGWTDDGDKKNYQHPLAYDALTKELKKILRPNSKTKFILTGHSLGGALAILFVAVLIHHKEELLLEKLEGVYTFGQPRVGDEEFKEFMTDQLCQNSVNYLRFVYCNDIVPRLPRDDAAFLFKHFGTCVYFNSCYEDKIVDEVPNKNYYSISSAIVKNLNAVWEIVRGFIMPCTIGKEYGENMCLTMLRLVGLIFPGIPAHGLQEYVNATRLGSTHPYENLHYC